MRGKRRFAIADSETVRLVTMLERRREALLREHPPNSQRNKLLAAIEETLVRLERSRPGRPTGHRT